MSDTTLDSALQKTFTLPCGYVDEKNVVCKEITLKKMSGHEEDVLDDTSLSINDRISKVLSMSIEKLGSITDKSVIEAAVSDTLGSKGLPLTAQDRVAALLFLRMATLGNTYDYSKKCPKCGHLNENKHLDLRSIPMSKVNDPTKRKVSVKLPISGKVAIIKVLSAQGEKKVSDLRVDQKDLKSYAILARLESLDSKPIGVDSDQDLIVVKDLLQPDRTYLIQIYQMIEGSVDTDVKLRCDKPGCGFDFEFQVDLGSIFMAPQAKKPTLADLQWI